MNTDVLGWLISRVTVATVKAVKFIKKEKSPARCLEVIFNQILIQTKLNRPAIGTNSVVPPRLIAPLDEGLKGRATLLSAPAGYGKTMLALQWIDQRQLSSAWLTIDETDSEPDRVLIYVATAICTLVPGFGNSFENT